ncbi:MAG: radical SAM family heme chaperone HemW [Candidatus Gracilibacteria bacterium]|nr:radical SAM family heme chaperone HemW [Candidatus Gracilibacteria bacterium]
MKNTNCYIHIPFCTSKCKYCRFASFSGFEKIKIQTYVDFLCNEINDCKENDLILDTIYFGGGTPGTLSISQFQKILETLKNKYTFSLNIEINIETTPENITKENLIGWKKLGINRISMGVQSLNENTLKEIGRASKGDIFTSLDLVKEVGWNNFSVDFIIGLPYVSRGEVLKNIKFLLKKYDFIKHISIYMLEEYYEIPDEKESKFDNITYPNSWKQNGICEDDYLEEYSIIKKYLNSENFTRYEISNYAKPGYECKHNYGYWTHKETLAFGLGAFGFINNIRFSNSENFMDYYNKKNIQIEKLSTDDIFLEKIMFSLRTSGIEKGIYEKLNNEQINYFVENDFLEIVDDRLILTNSGVLVMDYILGKIIF